MIKTLNSIIFLLEKEMCCCECTSYMNQMANSNDAETSDSIKTSVEENKNDGVSNENEKISDNIDGKTNQGFRKLSQNHKTMWPIEDNQDTSKSSSNEMDYTEDMIRNNRKKKENLNVIHIKGQEVIR